MTRRHNSIGFPKNDCWSVAPGAFEFGFIPVPGGARIGWLMGFRLEELGVLCLCVSELGTHHMSNNYMTNPIHVM